MTPAPDQGGVVAIGGQQNVLLTHGTGHAHGNRFLTKRDSVGAEPAGALERDSLEVEGTDQHHCPIKRDEQTGIGGEGRELPVDRTVRREVVAVIHLEACDHRELFVCAPACGHATAPVGNSFDQQTRGVLVQCYRKVSWPGLRQCDRDRKLMVYLIQRNAYALGSVQQSFDMEVCQGASECAPMCDAKADIAAGSPASSCANAASYFFNQDCSASSLDKGLNARSGLPRPRSIKPPTGRPLKARAPSAMAALTQIRVPSCLFAASRRAAVIMVSPYAV